MTFHKWAFSGAKWSAKKHPYLKLMHIWGFISLKVLFLLRTYTSNTKAPLQ